MRSSAADGRILLATRDTPERGALAWLFRERGYDVRTAEPPELLERARDWAPDLVLVEAEPDAGERSSIEMLRADPVGMPAVVAIGNPADANVDGADLVARPVQVPDLLTRTETHLRARAELRVLRATLDDATSELDRLRGAAEHNRRLVEMLHEMSGELAPVDIHRVLARRVARALDLSHAAVVIASPGEAIGVVAAAYEDPSISDLPLRLERYPEIATAIITGRPLLVEDARTDPLLEDVRQLWLSEGHQVPIRSIITVPFADDGERVAVLVLRTERMERALDTADIAFAEAAVRVAAAAARRSHALERMRNDNRRLEELATTDPLTRLLNRRALLDRLGAEVGRTRRFGGSLTLLLLDIDHFKRINDSRGHLAGDNALRHLAGLLLASTRAADVAARYGGEEFVLLLPETSREGAFVFAERLRERIASEPFEVETGHVVHLTASIGAATFPSPRVESPEDLLARADEALYRAKSNGRNQVRT